MPTVVTVATISLNTNKLMTICSIPDDHIDPRRSALFWQDRYWGNFQTGDTNVCLTS